MSINALLDEFKVKAATPKQQLAEYKAQGKKVIGVLPYYAPEELVYAAGMVPMGIWGSNNKTISRAKEYCATFYCTIAQLALEMLLDGTIDVYKRQPLRITCRSMYTAVRIRTTFLMLSAVPVSWTLRMSRTLAILPDTN